MFHHYLLNYETKVVIDHKAFMYLVDKPKPSARLAQWLLLMEEFNLEIVHFKKLECEWPSKDLWRSHRCLKDARFNMLVWWMLMWKLCLKNIKTSFNTWITWKFCQGLQNLWKQGSYTRIKSIWSLEFICIFTEGMVEWCFEEGNRKKISSSTSAKNSWWVI